MGGGGVPMNGLATSSSGPRQIVLPELLSPVVIRFDEELGELKTLLAWKRVRPTSTGLYAFLQDSGYLAHGRKIVLNAVAALYNAKQQWPIADEIQAWLLERKQIRDMNPNHVRPRLTDLSSGWEETPYQPCGEPTKSGKPCAAQSLKNGKCTKHGGDVKRDPVFVPCTILVAGEPRENAHGIKCATWHVREFSEVA